MLKTVDMLAGTIQPCHHLAPLFGAENTVTAELVQLPVQPPLLLIELLRLLARQLAGGNSLLDTLLLAFQAVFDPIERGVRGYHECG